jgi:erythromycin esterase-like protein
MKKYFIIIFCLYCLGYGSAFSSENESQELPVFSIDARKGLPFMLEAIRGKSIFLLGDASHGTEEYYGFRKLVTRHLLKDFGVRILVLEAEWDSVEKIDAYINGMLPPGTGPRKALREAFTHWPEWVWANEDLAEFVLWLKDFNRELPAGDRIHCYGMDMQQAVAASLKSLLEELEPGTRAGKLLANLVPWWQEYMDDPGLYKRRIIAGTEKANLLATEILHSLEQPSLKVKRLLHMLIAVEEYYRIMAEDQYLAWNVRARHMAGYVGELIHSESGKKGVVVWAHNNHIGDRSGVNGDGAEITNMGSILREMIGRENVFALGSAGFAGTVLGAEDWGLPPRVFSVPPPIDGSVESLLFAARWDNPLLFWQNDEQRRLWDRAFHHRGIGVVYDPQTEFPDNYLTINVSKRYDALVFWKKTRSLRLLEIE